tara:strand:+ start:29 stop:1297 length:1269 start_codon:yes stop_codon:yes gene_type:complete
MTKFFSYFVTICIVLSLFYLVPILSLEDRWKIVIQNLGNFLIFFLLGLILSSNKFIIPRRYTLFFLFSLSILFQGLQSFFDARQFDFSTISTNLLGALLGVFFLRLLVIVNKVVYQYLNNKIRYKHNYEELILSIKENEQYTSNQLKEILRNAHFIINKYLREEDNLDIELKTIYGEKINFPVMSGNIFKHIFYGTPEADTLLILKENTKVSSTVLDLGAHYGFFSLFLSNLVGNNGRVFSFEPTESTFRVLKKNIQKKNNIILHNQGFFSSNVSITFNHYGDNYSGLNSIYSPRLKENLSPNQNIKNFITLDSFCEEQNLSPDLIKIDCESSEYEILKGSKRILDTLRPVLVIEFGDVLDKDLPRSSSVYDFLSSKSFTAFRRYKEGYKEQERQEYYEYFNCLFVPEEKLAEFYSSNKIIS